jgi:DNA-binding CsgD family transcriptional regulator
VSILIATPGELDLLTKQEERIYRMFRLEGRTKEQIYRELKIGAETFRKHWHRAMQKIKKRRQLMENPQYYLNKNVDVLMGKQSITDVPIVDAEHLVVPKDEQVRKGSFVMIKRHLAFDDVETGRTELVECEGMTGRVTEEHEEYVVVECELYEGAIVLSIPHNEVELV